MAAAILEFGSNFSRNVGVGETIVHVCDCQSLIKCKNHAKANLDDDLPKNISACCSDQTSIPWHLLMLVAGSGDVESGEC